MLKLARSIVLEVLLPIADAIEKWRVCQAPSRTGEPEPRQVIRAPAPTGKTTFDLTQRDQRRVSVLVQGYSTQPRGASEILGCGHPAATLTFPAMPFADCTPHPGPYKRLGFRGRIALKGPLHGQNAPPRFAPKPEVAPDWCLIPHARTSSSLHCPSTHHAMTMR